MTPICNCEHPRPRKIKGTFKDNFVCDACNLYWSPEHGSYPGVIQADTAKRILMVNVHNDFPPDPRIAREVRELSDTGHQVTVLCPFLRHHLSKAPWGKAWIERFGFGKVEHKIGMALLYLTGRNPYWALELRATLKDGYDAIHCHDLPFLGECLRAGRRFKIPVIADLHENFAELVRVTRPSFPWWQRLVMWPSLLARREIRWGRKVEAVIVVCEEAKERLLLAGVGTRTVIVRNTEPEWRMPKNSCSVETLPPSPFRICYAGAVNGHHRGLDILIGAFAQLCRNREVDAHLVIAGGGRLVEFLRKEVLRHGLSEKISLPGWVEEDELLRQMIRAHVVVIPHRKNRHTDATAPNKLFQAMMLGRPVIVSDCLPMMRIVKEARSGCVFNGSQEVLCQCLQLYQSSREQLSLDGQRGRDYAKLFCDRNTDAEVIQRVYA